MLPTTWYILHTPFLDGSVNQLVLGYQVAVATFGNKAKENLPFDIEQGNLSEVGESIWIWIIDFGNEGLESHYSLNGYATEAQCITQKLEKIAR